MKASRYIFNFFHAMAHFCMCFLLLVKYSLHFYPSGLKADIQATAPPQSTNKSEVKRSPSPPSLHFSHMDSPDDCFYVRTETRIRTWKEKKKKEENSHL